MMMMKMKMTKMFKGWAIDLPFLSIFDDTEEIAIPIPIITPSQMTVNIDSRFHHVVERPGEMTRYWMWRRIVERRTRGGAKE